MNQITQITLQNFRCFSLFRQNIEKEIIVIQGDNGTGKSTILEAIHTAAFAKSFRSSDSTHLKKLGTSMFSVNLRGLDQYGDSWESKVFESAEKKEIHFNGKRVKAFKELVTKLRVITATEEDLLIIAGSPEHRRTFIDKAIAFEKPDYVELLQTQKKILLQKNALLKQPNPDHTLFTLWNQKQDTIDSLIREKRSSYSQRLITAAIQLGETLQEVIPQITALCQIVTPANEDERWIRESAAHKVLWGAQKDDITFTFNQLPARFFASRGQQKWTLLLLKLAQVQLLQQPTILLFDDFLTDLDPNKAQKIVRIALQTNAQIFITAPQNKTVQSCLDSFQPQVITLEEFG